MQLTNEQIQQYQENGLIYFPNVFSNVEVDLMRNELTTLMSVENSPDIAYENDGQTIRALHGCHLRSKFFDRLIKQARLINPTTQLLSNEEIYLHQFKVNVKKAFKGEHWPWHQDFVYWHMGDGIPTPKNLTAIIFLDEINEFNAPVFFIPGSHKEGSLNKLECDSNKVEQKDWKKNFSTQPNYIIDQDKISELIDHYGVISVKGSAGSVVFFDSNVIHASSQNISPYHRRMIFLAYNGINNIPPPDFSSGRPEFLASCNYSSLSPLMLDALF